MPTDTAEVPVPLPPLFAPKPKPAYIATLIGSIAIGVTLPSLLVELRTLNKPMFDTPMRIVGDIVGTVLLAGICCGPGAIILTLLLLNFLANAARDWSLRQTIRTGALSGIAMAFLNVPAYLVGLILEKDTFIPARVVLLFVVAGSSCGVWIAWQAWRATRPNESLFPRFSLQTLLLLVFLWGGVMLAFQPKNWASPPPVDDQSMVMN